MTFGNKRCIILKNYNRKSNHKGHFPMKTKYYTKMLFPLSLFGFIFRVLEIMFAIEPESGFYYTESVIPLLCNIYNFLVIAFFISETFLIKSENKSLRKRFGSISGVDKVLMLFAAVFILANALNNFLFELNINYSYGSVNDIFSASPVYVLIFAGLSCIFLVFFSSAPKKYATSSFMSILSLSITVYYLIRLFTRFLDLNEILSKAYGTYTILLLGFIVLSCMNFSKIIAGIFSKKYFIAFGLCTAYLAIIHLAEFIMSFLPDNPYNISVDIFAYAADFFIAAVILRFVLVISKKIDKSEKTAESAVQNDVLTESNSLNG